MYSTALDAPARSDLSFERSGYFIARDTVASDDYRGAHAELLTLAQRLTQKTHTDVDAAWNHIRATDRRLGSLLYNGAKLLPSIHRIAGSPRLLEQLRSLGMKMPAIVDVNFRIDSSGEDKFLFGWHQDYWFSICSPAAIVAWIPLTRVHPNENGGIEIVPRDQTGGRILKTRPGEKYSSYADAVVIDEEIPSGERVQVPMETGDVLLFRFDVLHRSLPVLTEDRSRWTLQVRYADLFDEEFRREQFKPGTVNAKLSTYAQRNK